MKALATDKSGPPAETDAESVVAAKHPAVDFEGELRARGPSKIEETSQSTGAQEIVDCLLGQTEREGFDHALLRNVLTSLYLRCKSVSERDLARLEDVLSLHGFLLFHDEI